MVCICICLSFFSFLLLHLPLILWFHYFYIPLANKYISFSTLFIYRALETSRDCDSKTKTISILQRKLSEEQSQSRDMRERLRVMENKLQEMETEAAERRKRELKSEEMHKAKEEENDDGLVQNAHERGKQGEVGGGPREKEEKEVLSRTAIELVVPSPSSPPPPPCAIPLSSPSLILCTPGAAPGTAVRGTASLASSTYSRRKRIVVPRSSHRQPKKLTGNSDHASRHAVGPSTSSSARRVIRRTPHLSSASTSSTGTRIPRTPRQRNPSVRAGAGGGKGAGGEGKLAAKASQAQARARQRVQRAREARELRRVREEKAKEEKAKEEKENKRDQERRRQRREQRRGSLVMRQRLEAFQRQKKKGNKATKKHLSRATPDSGGT